MGNNWVNTVNSWEQEYPTIEELFFGSIGSWLYLYNGHRNLFKITANVVPTVNIAMIHILGSAFYVVNHYLYGNMVLLILFTILTYTLYYTLIIHPILCHMDRSQKLRIFLLSLYAFLYPFIYILCESIARILVEGVFGFDGGVTFQAPLPKVFLVIFSLLAWILIICLYFPTLKTQSFNFKKCCDFRRDDEPIQLNDPVDEI